jgi:hypothetical protein
LLNNVRKVGELVISRTSCFIEQRRENINFRQHVIHTWHDDTEEPLAPRSSYYHGYALCNQAGPPHRFVLAMTDVVIHVHRWRVLTSCRDERQAAACESWFVQSLRSGDDPPTGARVSPKIMQGWRAVDTRQKNEHEKIPKCLSSSVV